MYAAQPTDPIRMTEADYLAFEAASEIRHEYSQGRVYDLSGGSVRHGVITMNIGTQLNIQLAETTCPVTSPDVRVYIARKEALHQRDRAGQRQRPADTGLDTRAVAGVSESHVRRAG